MKKMKIFKILFLLVLMIAILPSNEVNAQDHNYKGYSLFIYNFIKYIEWPEDNSKGEFVIGVVGDSPIVKELNALAAVKRAKDRPIVVKVIDISEAQNCHIVYISSAKSNSLKDMLPLVKNKSVLVIAEREGLAKKGACINFVTLEDDTLKFELNKSVMDSHNLKIQTALLKLGLIVG